MGRIGIAQGWIIPLKFLWLFSDDHNKQRLG